MKSQPKGMKFAMKGKSADPMMTGGAAGGLGRIEKSAAAGAKGANKVKS